MIKKFLCAVVAVCLLIGIEVFAENAFSIDPYGEFTVYKIGGEIKPVSKIMGISEKEFQTTCDRKNIIYFAVNSNKTKQIQMTCNETGFSNNVVNLSNLSNDSIRALMSDLTGDESIKGEIIEKNSQKFIKTQLSSIDSGGDYTVTEYITVAGKLVYSLRFFTSSSADTGYIDKTFETYDTKDFYSEEKFGSLIKIVLPIGIGIFVLISAVIIYTMIRDIRKQEVLPEDYLEEITKSNQKH